MFENHLKNVEILTVLDISRQNSDSKAPPRPYHGLSFRLKGDSVFVSEKDSVQAMTNDIVFASSNLGYHHKTGDERVICIHFLADNVPQDRIMKYSVSNSVLFKDLFCTMHSRWTQKKVGYRNGVMSDFYKILSNIEIQQSSAVPSNCYDISEYIHEHFTEPDFCVAKLYEVYDISPTYLQRLFLTNFNMSHIQYISNLRLNYATELIASNYYKISEVAEMCGFYNTKYFSTFVKKWTGKTPSQLKEQ